MTAWMLEHELLGKVMILATLTGLGALIGAVVYRSWSGTVCASFGFILGIIIGNMLYGTRSNAPLLDRRRGSRGRL